MIASVRTLSQQIVRPLRRQARKADLFFTFLATYGIMYVMKSTKRTTIYLPDRLKGEIERVADREGRSEADIIRDAVEKDLVARRAPDPRIPLVSQGLGAPDIAERAEELLDGFGR
jgi:Arc/MetJ-type ribon-helix-helix transcriptional regulator